MSYAGNLTGPVCVPLFLQSPVTSTPHKNGANGANGSAAPGKPSSPGNVDVTRGTVSGGDSAQVEHVTLKKKPKCKCCIVQ